MNSNEKQIAFSYSRERLIQIKKGLDQLLSEMFINENIDISRDEAKNVYSVTAFNCELNKLIFPEGGDDE